MQAEKQINEGLNTGWDGANGDHSPAAGEVLRRWQRTMNPGPSGLPFSGAQSPFGKSTHLVFQDECGNRTVIDMTHFVTAMSYSQMFGRHAAQGLGWAYEAGTAVMGRSSADVTGKGEDLRSNQAGSDFQSKLALRGQLKPDFGGQALEYLENKYGDLVDRYE